MLEDIQNIITNLKLRTALLIVVFFLPALAPSPAGASVDIPLHHWSYEAIERLVAMGVIDRAMVIPRPYSRREAAGYVKRGIERVRANVVRPDGREVVAELLLNRLMREFRPELIDLGIIRHPPPASAPDGGRKDERNNELGARKWSDLIRYGGQINVEGAAFSVGDGTVRFRENRMGEYYPNNVLVQASARGWLEFGDVLALSARPKVTSIEKVLGIGANANDKNIWLQELNAKLTLYNVSLEVGRGSFWWGPGYHGSLLITDHAFPLDRIALKSEQPFRLPWVLKDLGEWKINSFWGELERDRDFPRANVFGLRVNYLPADWLELGVTRLTQFGGRGRGQHFPKAVWDAYKGGINPGGDENVNEQAMIDARVRIPHVPYLVPFPAGAQLYGEIASEDDIEPTTLATLVGLYVPQVSRRRSSDLRVEFARTDLTRATSGTRQAWYDHNIWVSGMRHRGFPLGHHIGTNATDFFVRSTRYLSDNLKLGTYLNYQERNRNVPNNEKKYEVGTDIVWWLTNDLRLGINYTYQRIKNPGQITSIDPFQEAFAIGVTSHNHLFWTTVKYEY